MAFGAYTARFLLAVFCSFVLNFWIIRFLNDLPREVWDSAVIALSVNVLPSYLCGFLIFLALGLGLRRLSHLVEGWSGHAQRLIVPYLLWQQLRRSFCFSTITPTLVLSPKPPFGPE